MDVGRLEGALVGSAVADALGAPFEFGDPGEYSRRFSGDAGEDENEMIGGGAFDWAVGEFTDDTQMAVHLAESLVDNRLTLVRDDLWRRWRAWASSAADVGNTTRFALGFDDWRDVVHPDPEWTAANGALMRSTALALVDVSVEVRRRWTLEQAAMTHAHAAAGYGAWLGVVTTRAAVEGADPFAALGAALDDLPDSAREGFAEVLAEEWDPEDRHHLNGGVWVCLATAVWAVRGARSFEEAVVRAIDCGGDTDTVACVAGAIAGGVFSIDGIPSRWLDVLHGRPDPERRLGADDLARLARRLAGYST